MEEYQEEKIIGFDALYKSMLRCKKGVIWKDSVASYYLNGIERTINLEKQLKDGTYKPREPKIFIITCPKRREAASISIRDRIYQRSMNDNVVYPVMTKPFIKDNWACQKGKGPDAAKDRLREFLRDFYRHNGNKGKILQIDIKGYYPNMSHEATEKTFEKYLPEDVMKRTRRILHEQYSGDKGYNPGSQLIQIAGISVLNPLDHAIKEKIKAKYYIRYMDDMIILGESEKYLKECLAEISKYLDELGFEVHPTKTRIRSIDEGFMFLGFKWRLTESGKIIQTIDPKNVKQRRKKLRRAVNLAKKGVISKEKVDEMHRSWIDGHAKDGNTAKMIMRMEQFYKDLWRNES